MHTFHMEHIAGAVEDHLAEAVDQMRVAFQAYCKLLCVVMVALPHPPSTHVCVFVQRNNAR